jgi:hypothetical protein
VAENDDSVPALGVAAGDTDGVSWTDEDDPEEGWDVDPEEADPPEDWEADPPEDWEVDPDEGAADGGVVADEGVSLLGAASWVSEETVVLGSSCEVSPV